MRSSRILDLSLKLFYRNRLSFLYYKSYFKRSSVLSRSLATQLSSQFKSICNIQHCVSVLFYLTVRLSVRLIDFMVLEVVETFFDMEEASFKLSTEGLGLACLVSSLYLETSLGISVSLAMRGMLFQFYSLSPHAPSCLVTRGKASSYNCLVMMPARKEGSCFIAYLTSICPSVSDRRNYMIYEISVGDAQHCSLQIYIQQNYLHLNNQSPSQGYQVSIKLLEFYRLSRRKRFQPVLQLSYRMQGTVSGPARHRESENSISTSPWVKISDDSTGLLVSTASIVSFSFSLAGQGRLSDYFSAFFLPRFAFLESLIMADLVLQGFSIALSSSSADKGLRMGLSNYIFGETFSLLDSLSSVFSICLGTLGIAAEPSCLIVDPPSSLNIVGQRRNQQSSQPAFVSSGLFQQYAVLLSSSLGQRDFTQFPMIQQSNYRRIRVQISLDVSIGMGKKEIWMRRVCFKLLAIDMPIISEENDRDFDCLILAIHQLPKIQADWSLLSLRSILEQSSLVVHVLHLIKIEELLNNNKQMGGCLSEQRKSRLKDQSSINIQISNTTSNPNKSQLSAQPAVATQQSKIKIVIPDDENDQKRAMEKRQSTAEQNHNAHFGKQPQLLAQPVK